MEKRHKNALPFLVTLAGCVFMLAWVDPVNATEVTRQLTQKGSAFLCRFSISQLRKSEVAIVKNTHHDLKVVFKGFHYSATAEYSAESTNVQAYAADYVFIFPHFVKSSLQADILTWMKRE